MRFHEQLRKTVEGLQRVMADELDAAKRDERQNDASKQMRHDLEKANLREHLRTLVDEARTAPPVFFWPAPLTDEELRELKLVPGRVLPWPASDVVMDEAPQEFVPFCADRLCGSCIACAAGCSEAGEVSC